MEKTNEALSEQETAIKEEEEAIDAVFNDEPIPIVEVLEKDDESKKNLEQEVKKEGKTEEKESVLPVLIAGMTEDEIRESVKNGKEVVELKKELYRIHDKFYGRIGDFEQRIKAIPQQQMSSISPKAKERLSEEFPELAEILFDGAEEREALVSVASALATEPEKVDVNRIVENAMGKQSKDFELRLLKRDHPDFEEVKVSQDWADYVDSLTSEKKQKIEDSWDADFLSGELTTFKKFLVDKKQTSAEEDLKAKEAAKIAEEKKKRLQAAITPRGGKPLETIDPDDEEAAMMAAFNA